MIGFQFAINGTTLDAGDDIGAVAMRLWLNSDAVGDGSMDPHADEGDTPDDVAIYFPNGTIMAVADFMGHTAMDDAGVETEDEYDDLPVDSCTLDRLDRLEVVW